MGADYMNKASVIQEIIRIEGGYSDRPSDSGGPTKYGITEAVARANGYAGDMRDLPRSFAEAIYEQEYWDAIHVDEILKLSPVIAEELVDTGVNMGTGRAAEFLQRALNVLNKGASMYPDLKVDRAIGPRTLWTLETFLQARGADGETVLFRALDCLQGAFYVELCERREKDEASLFGWLLNRVGARGV
jgi:lysozyme family protein